MRLAEALYGDMPRGKCGKTEPARFLGGERRELRKLEQAHLALAFESPGHSQPDVYAAQVFATAFGGGMSSRLFQEAREKRGLCYTIFAQASAYADTGSLTIYAGTGAGEVAGLTELVVEQLRAAAEGLTAEEVDRARAQMKAGMVMGLESASNRAERHARSLEIWGRVQSIEETVARIEAVDVAAARAVGEKIVAEAVPALALYGPVEAAPGCERIAARLAA
jgi:predicted Zn-dependent peptidase